MITLDLSILNQKGTPMFYSDTLSLRPAFGIAGRIFIAIDSPYGIFRDTGTAWDQIAGSGGGGGIGGSGTLNTIALFTPDGSNIGNSVITQSGSAVNIAGRNTVITNGNITLSHVHSALNGTVNPYGQQIAVTNTFNAGITWTALLACFNSSSLQTNNWNGSASFGNASYTTNNLNLSNITFNAAGSTITSTQASGGIRAYANQILQFRIDGTNNGTYTHYANSAIYGDFASSTARLTITNRYGYLVNNLDEYSAGHTYTNRWAFYSAGINDNNFFAGKLGIGSGYVPSTFQLDVIGSARVSGVLLFTDASTGGTGSLNIAIANVAPFGGLRNIQIGNFSGVVYTGQKNVAIGNSGITIASIGSAVQIGNNSNVTGNEGVAIGMNNVAAAKSVAIGKFSSVTGTGSINFCADQFGLVQYIITNDFSFNIGSFCRGESTSNYQGILNAQNVFIGRPARATSTIGDSSNGLDTSINGMGGYALIDATGGNLTLAGGVGLGSGTSGDVIISTATPTITGTALQTLNQRWFVKGSTGVLANVASPNASAILQADSNTKGFLPPRMTTTQKNAIATPVGGLVIYDTTLVKLCVYNGASWETVTSI